MAPTTQLLVLLAALACAGCDVTGKAPSAPTYRGNAAPLSDPPSSAP